MKAIIPALAFAIITAFTIANAAPAHNAVVGNHAQVNNRSTMSVYKGNDTLGLHDTVSLDTKKPRGLIDDIAAEAENYYNSISHVLIIISYFCKRIAHNEGYYCPALAFAIITAFTFANAAPATLNDHTQFVNRSTVFDFTGNDTRHINASSDAQKRRSWVDDVTKVLEEIEDGSVIIISALR
ncbi:hypothetical protein BDQ17DRAFT_1433244 [Cyathus striatus]|nr:hypothetical protein BDQ17DRAFT_1433244 [Cyathus striatus]